ncbi:MAG: LysR substrate-binding domain-containing protein [Polyangiaceae bacterium]
MTHSRVETPEDLRKHQCLVHGDASAPVIWRFGTNQSKGLPVPVGGRFAANNSEAVALLAREGHGIALLADWLVKEDLERGRLVPLLESFAAPPAPVFALTPPAKFTSATIRALVDHLAEDTTSRVQSVDRAPKGRRPRSRRQ